MIFSSAGEDDQVVNPNSRRLPLQYQTSAGELIVTKADFASLSRPA
ncbi:MAG: hypothetical protein ABJ000_18425 [Saccharospirillum sp.]|nr:hypothetical protein [Saccharospirillum alexandrii]